MSVKARACQMPERLGPFRAHSPTPFPKPGEDPMTPAAETAQPPCVFYVDDHPINVRLMQALFDLQTGLQLLHAGSGREALEMHFAARPVLLLLDLRLPDIHGSQLLAMVRARQGWAALPAVAVTAEHDFDVFEAGFCEVWRKPLDLQGLLQSLPRLTNPCFGSAPGAPATRLPAPTGLTRHSALPMSRPAVTPLPLI